jgi:hypothetical protein
LITEKCNGEECADIPIANYTTLIPPSVVTEPGILRDGYSAPSPWKRAHKHCHNKTQAVEVLLILVIIEGREREKNDRMIHRVNIHCNRIIVVADIHHLKSTFLLGDNGESEHIAA